MVIALNRQELRRAPWGSGQVVRWPFAPMTCPPTGGWHDVGAVPRHPQPRWDTLTPKDMRIVSEHQWHCGGGCLHSSALGHPLLFCFVWRRIDDLSCGESLCSTVTGRWNITTGNYHAGEIQIRVYISYFRCIYGSSAGAGVGYSSDMTHQYPRVAPWYWLYCRTYI